MGKVLIGTDWGSYSFLASSKKVTITSEQSKVIKSESILLITHIPSGNIIYNFANPSAGATYVSSNLTSQSPIIELTLEYDTTSYSNGDALQIWIWVNDGDRTNALQDDTNAIREYIETLAHNSPIADASKRLRVIFDTNSSINSVSTVTTLSTVSTVTTLSNITNIGSFNASLVPLGSIQTPIEIQSQKIVIS